MKKILILGANGYIGARLCRFFAERQYEITAVSRTKPVAAIKDSVDFEYVVGDIRDRGLLTKLSESKFDVLINLVSLDHHQSNADPVYVSSVNVIPTWSLLDIFSKKGLSHYIYFSTSGVYGRLSSGIVNETYPANTINAYGLTHLLSENICDYYNRNSSTACSVLRLSNSYGSPLAANNNCWSLVINELCKSAFTQGKIKLLSDGSPLRDFIHGNDISQALELLIKTQNDDQKKGVYNLCSGTTLTIMELAQKVKDIYNKRYNKNVHIEIPSGNIKELRHYAGEQRYSIANNKLRSLGFQQTISLDQGINDLFDYLELYHEQLS